MVWKIPFHLKTHNALNKSSNTQVPNDVRGDERTGRLEFVSRRSFKSIQKGDHDTAEVAGWCWVTRIYEMMRAARDIGIGPLATSFMSKGFLVYFKMSMSCKKFLVVRNWGLWIHHVHNASICAWIEYLQYACINDCSLSQKWDFTDVFDQNLC